MSETVWKSQRDSYREALIYLQGRKEGKIRSFRTPWDKVNDAGVDGFEWHSMTVIGGRPGSGKTLLKDQIVREGFKLNSGSNIRVLEFQFEMLGRSSAVREFSSVLKKPYKYVCSADGKLTDSDLQTCYEYSKTRVEYPIDVVEKPCTVDEFKKTIRQYMNQHATTIDGKKSYLNTVVTLDHSLLLKKAPKESSKNDMLYNLGEACTELKRQYPIAFIILSQLNRGIDNPERNEDGRYGNYILESDIFGADALLQHADIVIGINRPAMKFIKFYGPDRYIIDDDSVLVFHFLKCRNGDTRMSFFKAMFDQMCVREMATPGRQEKRVSTN